jgi:hypothetical protein
MSGLIAGRSRLRWSGQIKVLATDLDAAKGQHHKIMHRRPISRYT